MAVRLAEQNAKTFIPRMFLGKFIVRISFNLSFEVSFRAGLAQDAWALGSSCREIIVGHEFKRPWRRMGSFDMLATMAGAPIV